MTTVLVRLEHATLMLYLERVERKSAADTRVVLVYPNRSGETEYVRAEKAKLEAETAARIESEVSGRFLRAFSEPHHCSKKGARARNDDVVLEVTELCYFGREVILSFTVENRGRESPSRSGSVIVNKGASKREYLSERTIEFQKVSSGVVSLRLPEGDTAGGPFEITVSEGSGKRRSVTVGGLRVLSAMTFTGDSSGVPRLATRRGGADSAELRRADSASGRSAARRDPRARRGGGALRDRPLPGHGRHRRGVPGAPARAGRLRPPGRAEVHPRRARRGRVDATGVRLRGAAREQAPPPQHRGGLSTSRTSVDRYYLVLEYVDGVTVRRVIRAARADAAGAPARGVLLSRRGERRRGAAPRAHPRRRGRQPLGIVHRDVTAVNVMVARSGVVKLLDFGVALARLEGRERTRTGQFRGTFVYASPEQDRRARTLDGRSDLFSLGRRARRDAHRESACSTPRRDVGTMRKIAECSPTDVEAATAGLPRELAAICAKALARRPADRFEDGAALSRRSASTSRAKSDHVLAERLCRGAARARRVGSCGAGGRATEPGDWRRERCGGERLHAAITAGERRRGDVVPPVHSRSPRPCLARSGGRRLRPSAARRAPCRPPVAGGSSGTRRPQRRSEPMPAAHRRRHPRGRAATDPLLRTRRRSGARSSDPKPSSAEAPAARRPTVDRRRSSGASAPLPNDRPPSSPIAPTVGSPRATLPRGTLVPVKLTRALAGPDPGRAEAIVTEDVAADGVVLVPKGSTVSCSARPPAGRACPALVRHDQHVGSASSRSAASPWARGSASVCGCSTTRSPPGTPFVVYVSAPAALR